MRELRVVTVLVVFAVGIIVCNADPIKTKEPPQPVVHVYAVPSFSVKPTSPGESRHYIVKEGSNVTLTCDTSFTNKNVLIDWVHPKADNEYEEKQIHSRHDGMNIKERILHIKNARAEDSGNYTCHTRGLHQTTWVSPNTFYIQVGEEKKMNNVGVNQKHLSPNMKTSDKPTVGTKMNNIDVNQTHLRPNMKTADKPTVRTQTLSKRNYTSTATKGTTNTTTSSTTTTSTRPTTPKVTTTTVTQPTSLPTSSTKVPPPAPQQFDVASFLGGMALVVGILLLLKLIHLAIKKHRQRNYNSYENM